LQSMPSTPAKRRAWIVRVRITKSRISALVIFLEDNCTCQHPRAAR
jgi:hypothetical protein